MHAGNLVVSVRPAHYTERRTDGYQEPQLIFILGTAHVSQQSAAEVEQVVAAVQPQAVVVELCKSRVGVLQVPEHHGHQQQTTASPQQQQRQQDQQQELQQSAQSNQASAAAIPSGSASDSLDECITVLQDRLGSHQTASSTSSGLDTAAAAHYWARRQKTAAYLASSGRAAATKSSSSSGNQQQDDVQLAEPSSSSSRSSKATNPMSLSGANFLSALTRSAQLGGQSGLLLRLLIAGQARKVADQLGVQPGAEFRAAARAADAVGASLVLGDRPVEITLQRAWGALSWWRRLTLMWDLLTISPASWEDAHGQELNAQVVERLRSDDSISAFYKSLSKAYPELVNPLIAERDLYLAWSLKRSKAANGAHAVVGVVGKGHLRGIVYALKHDNGQLRFADLVGGKNRKKTRQEQTAGFAKRLLIELCLGAGLYAAWVAVTAATQH
eukprot:GHUV01028568.1.p1 GENE.GHUV01028568.1~~GHUV01028568.1.p1  ORF type:complete len:443 (+),score=150.15 GHUV01028568.1:754-2082(+)